MSFFSKKTNNDKISIDTTSVVRVVEQIRKNNKNMYNEAKSILDTVERLDGDWDSDVYKDFKTRVKKTGEIYEQYYMMIENIALLLEGAADIYEKTEKGNLNALGG